jgi:hypothetical protein
MSPYYAFGLRIDSALPLPELMPSPLAAAVGHDVVVRFGRAEPRGRLSATGVGFSSAAPAEACHHVQHVGAFVVRHGREIIVDPEPGVEERLLRLSVLGPALGLLLHQRGFLVLHASVVAHDDHAMAFLGKNGFGKSTIAAALHRKGYDLVTDDVAAIRFDDGVPVVVPAFPQLKLWPEAAALLGEDPDQLPILHPQFDKRAWRPAPEFSQEPRRLACINVIAPGPTPAIEPLPPRDGFFELLGHWYGHRFGDGLLQDHPVPPHVRQCAALAGRVPVRRLHRSGGSPMLLELAALVDDDFRRAVAPSQ